MILAMKPPETGPPSLSTRQKRARGIVLGLLICGIVLALWFARYTDLGQQIFDDSAAVRDATREWVDTQPLLAAGAYAAIYLLCAMLLLPIWWLQILSGFVFGLAWGCTYSLVAAALAATVTMLFSRWLAGAWFRQNIASHMDRVQWLTEKLDDNGLLVVMAVRLAYFTPFGISNYLFGLTRIKPAEVFVGSILGGFPALAIYVTIGADFELFQSFRYWLIFGSINLLLVTPLALRYLWPTTEDRVNHG